MWKRTAGLMFGLAVCVSACAAPAARRSELPSSLLPATLPQLDTEAASLVLRLRVYAGADYRARLVGWEEELAVVVLRSSALLQHAAGLRLELVETIKWKRSGGALGKTLQSIASLDPGADVDLVVGLIDAPAVTETEYGRLFKAEVLGKHAVVRSFNLAVEAEAVGTALDERRHDELMNARRRHKQTLILATAVATLYGSREERLYDRTQDALSEEAGQILPIVVVAAQSKDLTQAWTKAKAQLEGKGSAALLGQIGRKMEEGSERAPEPSTSALRTAALEQLANAKSLFKAGKIATSWEVLEPLTELYAGDLQVVELACLVASARGASDAVGRCRAATKARPKSGHAWLALGTAEATPAAFVSLQVAGRLLKDASARLALAKAYRKFSLASLALAALTKTKPGSREAESIGRWANQARNRYGVHIGVQPEAEGRFLASLKAALKLVYRNDYKAAGNARAELVKLYPKSVAGQILACEIGLRRRNYSKARLACTALLKRHPDNVWARYLLAVLDIRQKRNVAAVLLLNEVIALDPDLKAAYEALAKIYDQSGDARLRELRVRFKEHFGSELG